MATVAEVKADLNAIRGAQERLNRRMERLMVLRSQIERITPVLSDMPKGGGELDRRGKMLYIWRKICYTFLKSWVSPTFFVCFALRIAQ
jgi:hypothetical protein